MYCLFIYISCACAAEQFVANCTFHSLSHNYFITTVHFSPMSVPTGPVFKLFTTNRAAELPSLPVSDHFTHTLFLTHYKAPVGLGSVYTSHWTSPLQGQ